MSLADQGNRRSVRPYSFLIAGSLFNATDLLQRATAALVTLSLLLVGSLDSNAQATRAVADPQGRFTISFPEDWTVQFTKVEGHDALVAVAPTGPGGISQQVISVVVDSLPTPMSSEIVAKSADQELRAKQTDYVVIEEGPTIVAALQAYYRYYTMTNSNGVSLFNMQTYIAVQRQVVLITGTFRNDPDEIRRDTPIIKRIVGTFQPNLILLTAEPAKPSAPPSTSPPIPAQAGGQGSMEGIFSGTLIPTSKDSGPEWKEEQGFRLVCHQNDTKVTCVTPGGQYTWTGTYANRHLILNLEQSDGGYIRMVGDYDGYYIFKGTVTIRYRQLLFWYSGEGVWRGTVD